MPGQKSDSTYDSALFGWFLIIGLVFIGCQILWYYQKQEIRDAVRWIRYSQMLAVSPFLPEDYTLEFKVYKKTDRTHVYNTMEHQRAPYEVRELKFHEQLEKVPQYEKKKLNNTHMSVFTVMAMEPLKMPIVYLIGSGALWCLFLGPTSLYRRRHGLEDLIRVQSKNFPTITPFITFNPSKQPPRPPGSPVPAELPAFAEALGPEEWLAFNSIPTPDGTLSQEGLKDAFTEQLGPRWKGPFAMQPHRQILLAAFCLKASRKRSEADEMLGAIARCWSFEHGLELSRDKKLLKKAQDILKNKDLAGKTLAACNQHAFETTVMLRGLLFAREQGGVLAPAQFVWLRAYDRALWYPLNNLGRHSFHTESLGAMAHFKAEKLTRRPIPVPKVEAAVSTLNDYMKSKRARPIPQLDYSKSKKKGVKKAV